MNSYPVQTLKKPKHAFQHTPTARVWADSDEQADKRGELLNRMQSIKEHENPYWSGK